LPADEVVCCDLGLTEYARAWQAQLALVELRAEGKIGDVLLLVEHPHVFTLGRKGDERNILDRSIPVYRVERGGDATYHGPGQLVAYPIIDLNKRGLGVKEFVNVLEDVCISVLRRFGVQASRLEGKPGVWVCQRKIVSIGLAIRHWVTFHGLAFNVNTDMRYFSRIRPCGMEAETMVSLHQLKGQQIDLAVVKVAFKEEFAARLGVRLIDGTLEDLLRDEKQTA